MAGLARLARSALIRVRPAQGATAAETTVADTTVPAAATAGALPCAPAPGH